MSSELIGEPPNKVPGLGTIRHPSALIFSTNSLPFNCHVSGLICPGRLQMKQAPLLGAIYILGMFDEILYVLLLQ